jgi:Holliday junction resolvasome RuvABC endonuclease subunit
LSKILIALDESTTCTGYAVFDDSELIEHGTFSFKSKDVLERVSLIMEEIENLIDTYKPDNMIIEDVQITMNAATAKSLLGLQFMIEVYAHRNNISCETYRTTRWRKILGLSNSRALDRKAKKQETIDYVKDKYGIEILKDDESDAIAIGTAYLLEKEE